MRVVMMGSGPFALPTFRSLLAGPHEVAALVTRPPRQGPGQRLAPRSSLCEPAEQQGVPVFFPESINAPRAHELLQSLAAELFVVCDYGQILSHETLAMAPRGGVNLHGSLLPKYRGAAPVQWAVYQGETETGVTVIHMTPRLDAGPILAQRATPIGPDETAAELEPRLAELGVPAVDDSLQQLAVWDGVAPLGRPQPSTGVSRAPRLSKADGRLDWSRSAAQLRNQIRAFQPWPGSYTTWLRHGSPLRLLINRAAVVENESLAAAPPGVVIDVGRERLIVAAGEGALSIERLQPAGKRDLAIAEFLRGYPLAVGDLFGDAREPS